MAAGAALMAARQRNPLTGLRGGVYAPGGYRGSIVPGGGQIRKPLPLRGGHVKGYAERNYYPRGRFRQGAMMS